MLLKVLYTDVKAFLQNNGENTGITDDKKNSLLKPKTLNIKEFILSTSNQGW